MSILSLSNPVLSIVEGDAGPANSHSVLGRTGQVPFDQPSARGPRLSSVEALRPRAQSAPMRLPQVPARGSAPLKPLAQCTKPLWGWICQADRPL